MIISKKRKVRNNVELDYDKLGKTIANNTCNVTIDYDKLATSIVKALNNTKEQETRLKEESNEQQRKEVFRKLGIDTNGTKKNIIKRGWANFWMPVRYKREYVTDHSLVFDLMKTISTTFFIILTLGFILVGFVIIGNSFSYESIFDRGAYASVGFVLVYFSNVFRVASHETDRMTDKEDISRTFTSIIAFLSIIVAAVGVVMSYHK